MADETEMTERTPDAELDEARTAAALHGLPVGRMSGPGAGVLFRSMGITVLPRERAADAKEDDEDAPIPVALSSEEPVERYDWWEGRTYQEILDHSAESVDLSYAADGLPFLDGHDTRRQVGILEEVAIGDDRKLRGQLRFSRSQAGREYRQDVLDGIRRKVSVGYLVQRTVTESTDEVEGDTVRVTRWTPMEGSGVAIPADYSVGYGRSADRAARRGQVSRSQAAPQGQEHTVSGEDTAARNGAPTATVDASQQERDRVNAILTSAREHGVDMKQAQDWIQTGRSADDVNREILRSYQSGQRSTAPAAPATQVKLTEREEAQYSIARGIQACLGRRRDIAGFEMEISDQIAKDLKRDTNGFFVPTSIRAVSRAGLPDNAETRRRLGFDTRNQLEVATAAKGGNAVFDTYGGFIDLLRNRSALLQLGAQMLPGLQGNPSFVGQSGAGVVGWNTESVNQALSSLSLALRKMEPKNLQSATTYTRQLLLQAPFSIENLVRNDIARLHALEIDRAGIAADGTNDDPVGILATAGIGAVVGGANGALPTYENMVDLETEVAIDNADIGTLAYLTNAKMRGRLKKTAELANTAALPVWRGGKDGEMNGYTAMASNQVPGDLTKGTADSICSAIIFGAFSEILIGEWGAMEMIVDEVTLGPTVIKLMSIEFIDVFIRHAEAFAAMQDALAA